MTLTKANLVAQLLGLNLRETKEFVESFFEEIRLALAKGEEVKLSGFGNFHLRNKRARPGRNPRTGEEVEISARRVATFKAGGKLKNKVTTFLRKRNDDDSKKK